MYDRCLSDVCHMFVKCLSHVCQMFATCLSNNNGFFSVSCFFRNSCFFLNNDRGFYVELGKYTSVRLEKKTDWSLGIFPVALTLQTSAMQEPRLPRYLIVKNQRRIWSYLISCFVLVVLVFKLCRKNFLIGFFRKLGVSKNAHWKVQVMRSCHGKLCSGMCTF
jgi:hypothetical protein